MRSIFSERRQRGWSWVLEEKFLDPLSYRLKRERDFFSRVAKINKENCILILNSSLRSELASCSQDWILKLVRKSILAHSQSILKHEMLVLIVVQEQMLYSIIGCVLTYIDWGESESIWNWSEERDCVMHKIEGFETPLTEILGKSSVEMAFGRSCGAFVVWG